MARAMGVGGVFFKSSNPEKLGQWYHRWLDLQVDKKNQNSFCPAMMPAHETTVWAPFKDNSNYFEPCLKEFMLNLIVDDLTGALNQVAEGGGRVLGDIQITDEGYFGWFLDPDGNKVELWQPTSVSYTSKQLN